MKRALSFWAALSGSSCVSAPKTPAELIVGAWNCKVAAGSLGGDYRLELTPSGEMEQTTDGVWALNAGQLDVSMEVASTYVVAGQKLEAKSPTLKVHRFLLDGAEIPASEQPAFNQLLGELVRRRISLTIETLDARQLVLSDDDNLTSCKRQAS